MNLFTGRQARPQASINSLKWLWVVCWGLSPQRQKLFIWQTLYLLYRNSGLAHIFGILPTAFTLLSNQLCYLTRPYKITWIVGGIVVCLFSFPTFAALSIQYVGGTDQTNQIIVLKDNGSPGVTTVKLYIAYSDTDSQSGCTYTTGNMLLIEGSTATTTNLSQAQANATIQIPYVGIGGEVSKSVGVNSSLQLPKGYYADISRLKTNKYWWINAIGLNKDGLIIEDSGWNIHSDSLTKICTYKVQEKCNFSDMDGLNEKQTSAILNLCGKEIISGYLDQNGHPDQSIQPDNPIKRSEFAKIIAKADGFKEDAKPNLQGTTSFTDVHKDKWYYKYVVYVHSKSFMQGDNNKGGEFRPADNINRAEAIKTIYTMFKEGITSYLNKNPVCGKIETSPNMWYCPSDSALAIIGCKLNDYKVDSPTVWYCPSVSALEAIGCLTDDYMIGRSTEGLQPTARDITRKEAFAILNCVITKTEG